MEGSNEKIKFFQNECKQPYNLRFGDLVQFEIGMEQDQATAKQINHIDIYSEGEEQEEQTSVQSYKKMSK